MPGLVGYLGITVDRYSIYNCIAQIHEHMRKMMLDLYEHDAMFDQFDLYFSHDDRYNQYLLQYPWDTGIINIFQFVCMLYVIEYLCLKLRRSRVVTTLTKLHIHHIQRDYHRVIQQPIQNNRSHNPPDSHV